MPHEVRPDDRHRAISIYAVAARDIQDFVGMLGDDKTTVPCLEILESMCALTGEGTGPDKELDRLMLPIVRQVLAKKRTEALH